MTTTLRRSRLVLALALLAPACASAGGETATAQTSVEQTVPGATEQTSTTATTSPAPVEMPDLIGLTETEARSRLSELGLEEPSVTGRGSFERAGVVLEQVPSAGRVVTGRISLIVAEGVEPVPDFVGMKIADVRRWAEPLGIDVRINAVPSAEKADGEVIEHVPAAGAEAVQELVVTVAETPRIVNLSDLQPVSQSRYEIEEIQMDGTVYPSTGKVGTSGGNVSFNLSRDWATLEMTLGLDDTLGADTSASVEFIADGQVIQTERVVFGATNQVSLDMTGVLRLQITATLVTGRYGTWVGLGDARLIGSASSTGAASAGATSTSAG